MDLEMLQTLGNKMQDKLKDNSSSIPAADITKPYFTIFVSLQEDTG
jgi:hypothetical protein